MIASMMVGSLLLATLVASSGAPMAGVAAASAHDLVGDQELYLQIADYLEQLDGSYGIAVENLGDGDSVLINSDRRFPTASMYKLAVMYRVFQGFEEGSLSPDDAVTITQADRVEEGWGGGLSAGTTMTVSEALEAMITCSSNSAAYSLARRVGGWEEVLDAAGEAGVTIISDGEQFVSTPADLLRFFQRLDDGSLVSPEASQEMVALLLRQTVNDRIPAQLPSDVPVAHKTGELPQVRNDGGIVLGPAARYIIVLMSEEVDPEEAIEAEAEISRMVYERYGAD